MNKFKVLAVSASILMAVIFLSNCNSKNIKMIQFDPDKFVPDTTYQTLFPWTGVEACLKDTLESKNYLNHTSCPKCGMKPEKLFWINYISPDSTWQNLSGREGPLSICPDCKIQVEFIRGMMN